MDKGSTVRRLLASGFVSLALLATAACGSNVNDAKGHGGSHTGGAGGAVGGSGGETTSTETTTDPDTVDDDGDGFSEAQGDCNDANPLINPDAAEDCGDGIDNNCNGAVDASEPDGDGDGFGPCNGDCNDADPAVSPAAAEVDGDGVDNNCDGVVDADFDADGYTVADGDCDDGDPAVNPGAKEICLDGIDNDCNGFADEQEPDVDQDGYGPCDGDCAEGNPNIGPGQPEIPNDGIDNNCDNLIDLDIDGDGWTTANGDCDDNNPAVNPSVLEVCSDNIDNDCDSVVDTDCLTKCELAAIQRSSVGCSFFAVDTNPIHSFVPGDYAVAVSNIDPKATANVVIELWQSNKWTAVANGTFAVGPLDLQSRVLTHKWVQGTAWGDTYRITSDLPVIAYQFNPLDGSSSYLSDASLLLPVAALDKYYLVSTWQYGPADGSSTSGHPAHIQIVASKPTEVRITSPIATVAGNGIPALKPNVMEKIQVPEGKFLQLTVQTFKQSLMGTYIESDEPIAVFAANDCSNVPALGNQACCCEHLEEQLFGLQTWGTKYVASRVPERTNNANDVALWHVMAQENGTTVTFDFNGAVTGLPANVKLDAGKWGEYLVGGPTANPGDFYITADKPIHVMQYMVGTNYCGANNIGDPSMIQAVPAEQYLKTYVVLVPKTWQQDYLILTREQGATVTVDGNPVNNGWVAVGTSKYEVNRLLVADGVHKLDGSAPFGVIVIGYDSYDSYGYPGGLDQQIINPIN